MCFKVRCTFGRPLARRRKSSWDQFCGLRPSLHTEDIVRTYHHAVVRSRTKIKLPPGAEPKLRITAPNPTILSKNLRNFVERSPGCINPHKKAPTQIKEGNF
jgi:hypothetical protein